MNTAEYYDPTTRSWSSTANDMDQDRKDDQTATLLPDGMVLIAGGAQVSAQLYNPDY